MRLTPQKRDFLYSSFSQLEKKWQALFERRLSHFELSYVQYGLLELLVQRFYYPPSFKEVAAAMETSHQNVKQIALILQKKELIGFVPDTKDGRIVRIQIVPRAEEIVGEFRQKKKDLIRSFFSGLNDEEIDVLFDLLLKVEMRADELLSKKG